MTPAVAAAAPLILTLALDADAQAWFDRQRTAYFPPARNVLAAHLTLFHHLPADHTPAIVADIEDVCGRHGPLPLIVAPPFLLGGGVAYALDAPALVAVHDVLTPQDRQPFRPHVTVQNKVPPAEARALHARLREAFVPFNATGEGLTLWHYRGGPWQFAGAYPFRG